MITIDTPLRIEVDADIAAIASALQRLRPGAHVELVRWPEGVFLLNWDHREPVPTNEEIAAAIAALPAEQAAERETADTERQQWRAVLRAYLDNPSPLPSETVRVVKILIRLVARAILAD